MGAREKLGGEEGSEEERRVGGKGEEREHNNLTANDGMPGSYPLCAGLHTDQQLPESI